ncbi:MAG: glycosyl hydrolase family 28 protein [Clostridiales bacterium]|nr:glycosyl hydrolase family 28 protein [Clostridiales bacterium]
MAKKRRGLLDKLNTLLFGKDLRITNGGVYCEVLEHDFSSYYPESDYIKPQALPKGPVFDIRDFGANVKCSDNAPFINAAVAEAANACGTVLISGGNYITSEIKLQSNIVFFIEKDSALSSNLSGSGYPDEAVIFAKNAENIAITGGGKIIGNGNYFGRKPMAAANETKAEKYIDVIEMRKSYRAQLRFAHPTKYGGAVSFINCKNVKAENIIIENSAYWSFKLVNCDGALVKDFVINNNRNVANADGIDIASSNHVNIEHCFISTADDGIVIKNAVWLGCRGAMSGVNINGCEIISRTNAIKVGTETTFDIKNINIKNCRLFMTDLYPGSVSGISLEACDGTALSNVSIDNIVMHRCTCPLLIRLGNRNRAAAVNSNTYNTIEFGKRTKSTVKSAAKSTFNEKSSICDINISNVEATGVEIPIIISGYRQRFKTHRVKNVQLHNIRLQYADIPETVDRRLFIPEYATQYPESWRFRNLPAYALWSRHTENVTTNNFTCRHPQKTWKKEIIEKDKR